MDGPDPRGGVPIAEAAQRLGVTIELLRKRAQRRTIPAYKADGRWFVVLDAEASVQDGTPERGQDRTSRPGQATTEATRAPVVPPAAMAQLEAIRDQWLAPLVARIEALSHDNGRLQAERDALAAEVARDRGLADQLVDLLQEERDAAQRRILILEARLNRTTAEAELAPDPPRNAPEAAGATERAPPNQDAGPAWRRAWRRLVGRG